MTSWKNLTPLHWTHSVTPNWQNCLTSNSSLSPCTALKLPPFLSCLFSWELGISYCSLILSNVSLICHFVCSLIKHHCLDQRGVFQLEELKVWLGYLHSSHITSLEAIPCQSNHGAGLKLLYKFFSDLMIWKWWWLILSPRQALKSLGRQASGHAGEGVCRQG